MEPKNWLNEGVSYKIYEKEMQFPVKTFVVHFKSNENYFLWKTFSFGQMTNYYIISFYLKYMQIHNMRLIENLQFIDGWILFLQKYSHQWLVAIL